MRKALLVAAITVVAACSNKLGGDVTVNGEAFSPDSCRNGVVHGFRGVEVTAKSGMRLRIGATQTGEARVAVLAPGASTGADLGLCGTLSISDQNSTVNDVRNVEGKATLDCAADGMTIKGSLSFENCH